MVLPEATCQSPVLCPNNMHSITKSTMTSHATLGVTSSCISVWKVSLTDLQGLQVLTSWVAVLILQHAHLSSGHAWSGTQISTVVSTSAGKFSWHSDEQQATRTYHSVLHASDLAAAVCDFFFCWATLSLCQAQKVSWLRMKSQKGLIVFHAQHCSWCHGRWKKKEDKEEEKQ